MVSQNAAHLRYAHRVYYLKDGEVVREVVTPQRKQIKPVKEGETIVTELEQLARLFPYDSVETLRVKSMVNYLTQDYTYDQLVRLERAIGLLLAGKVDKDAFIKNAVQSYERGGVEIPEAEAKRMAKTCERLMSQADDIRRFRNQYDKPHTFFDQHKLAERLKEHILNAHRLTLSKKQNENLTEIIADRVVGVSGEDTFNEMLMKGITSNGLGLSEAEADDITRYFEKLIAQGVDVSYKS